MQVAQTPDIMQPCPDVILPSQTFISHCHFRFCIAYTFARKHYESQSAIPECRAVNKKALLTQGLRATAPSFQDGGCSKMAVSRHLGYYRTGNRAIRSADPENPCLEPQMEWIGCTVCEIFAFKLYCDFETGVRGHSGSLKVAP